MSGFWDVFNIVAALYAAASGVLLGSTFLLYLTLRFPPAFFLPMRRQIPLSFIVLSVLGVVFFAGQISQAIVIGDPQYPRIVARLALWILFAGAVSVSHAFSRSFAARRDTDFELPSLEKRLNMRADVRALEVRDRLDAETELSHTINEVTDDTHERVIDIQGRGARGKHVYSRRDD